MTTKKQQKEFEKYLHKQFTLMEEHHARIMLRCWHKLIEMKDVKQEEKGC